jgi:hypothetical protein
MWDHVGHNIAVSTFVHLHFNIDDNNKTTLVYKYKVRSAVKWKPVYVASRYKTVPINDLSLLMYTKDEIITDILLNDEDITADIYKVYIKYKKTHSFKISNTTFWIDNIFKDYMNNDYNGTVTAVYIIGKYRGNTVQNTHTRIRFSNGLASITYIDGVIVVGRKGGFYEFGDGKYKTVKVKIDPKEKNRYKVVEQALKQQLLFKEAITQMEAEMDKKAEEWKTSENIKRT